LVELFKRKGKPDAFEAFFRDVLAACAKKTPDGNDAEKAGNQTNDLVWKELDVKNLLADAPWAMALRSAGVKFNAKPLEGDKWQVEVLNSDFNNCSIFKGAPIARLKLAFTSVTDIAPLNALPLVSLDLSDCPLRDLAPVEIAPWGNTLRELHLNGTNVTDFSPVRECAKLEYFDASYTPIRDLECIRALKLRTVKIDGTAISDISVLKGMPLEWVQLSETPVNDISPLLDCKMLNTLILPPGARDVKRLEKLYQLQFLSYDGYKLPYQTATNFWDTYNPHSKDPTKLFAQGQYDDAEAAWTKEIDDNQNNPPLLATILTRRAHLRARRGKFADAIADFKRALVLDPNVMNSLPWFPYWQEYVPESYVAVLLYNEDIESYRKYRPVLVAATNRALLKSRDNGIFVRAVKSGCLDPIDGADLAPFSKIARAAINQWNAGHNINAEGFAEFRRGDFEASISTLSRVIDDKGFHVTDRAQVTLITAMAQMKLGRVEKANELLARAVQMFNHMPKPGSADMGGYWFDILIAHSFLREAQGLIGEGNK